MACREHTTLRRVNRQPRQRGFTLLEVTIVSGLMAFLAVLLSAAWTSVGRSSSDLIVRGRIAQEIDLAMAALSRDLGGSLSDPASRLGAKKQGQWVGWTAVADDANPPNTKLLLCFDGGTDPNGQPDWALPDNMVVYQLESNALTRWDQNANTTFTVARYVDGFVVAPEDADAVRIVLTFKYRKLTRTCTLIVRSP
jgi:prepilin-type N-terminal cleavage/methylation domain-containing protein